MSDKNRQPDRIELRSESVQEILGYVPHWMVRWGNTIVFVLVIGLFLISYYVQYPDKITSKIILDTEIPSDVVYASTSGKLSELNVADGDKVEKGTLLANIEAKDGQNEVLKSSMEGHVYFVDFWKNELPIVKNDMIFRIIPLNNDGFVGKIQISARQSGKIKKGQNVRIRWSIANEVESSPISATIDKLAQVPDKIGNINIQVRLPKEKMNRQNPYKPGHIGTAEIITEDVRLIERFLGKLVELFE